MKPDFTFQLYDGLLESIRTNGYEVLTVRDYVSRSDLPERYLILRHDIDRKPENALRMARMEADHGIASTYYFRIIEKTFVPDLITEIESLGHEVGYHYEDVDMADGDLTAATESFVTNLARFREFVTVDTVSMHGNPLTPYDNRDIWQATDLETHGLRGEVYHSVDFSDVVYFSDTNRTWYDEKTIVNDWPVGPSTKDIQINTTTDLIELVESQSLPRLYLLVHSNRWANSRTEWLTEVTKDTAINGVKWGLWVVRSARDRTRPTPRNV
jgi:hypothetical protein